MNEINYGTVKCHNKLTVVGFKPQVVMGFQIPSSSTGL